MTYLNEILSFGKLAEQGNLNVREQAYWYQLIEANNAAAFIAEDEKWYWPVGFNLPNSCVLRRLRLDNLQQLYHLRRQLIAKGLITYRVNPGQCAGEYRLIPFDKGVNTTTVIPKKGGASRAVYTQSKTEGQQKAQPYVDTVDTEKATLHYNNTTPGMGFNLPPQLSQAQQAAIESLYPEDSVARFYAIWEARQALGKGVKA